MSESTGVAISERKAITVTVAERYGMEADTFEVALRNTVFLEGSKAEYAAFLVVCNEYKLNPLTKEIYAFKNKSGKIVPVVSIDGWVTLCNTHPQFDGMTFEDQVDADGKLFSITCTIYRKDRRYPTVIPEYLSECIRNTDPWKMQHRMLRHKALIQCARYAFGFSGIYDQEEAEFVNVDIVSSEPSPKLTSGFGDEKPVRAPRKAKAEVAAATTEKQPAAAQGTQEAGDDGEFQDAEFESAECDHTWNPVDGEEGVFVCPKCGELKEEAAEDERPTETGSVQGAETGQGSSDSATDASTASAEATSSQTQPDGPSQSGTAAATQAPRDVVYRLYADEIEEDGRFPTYKNGALFSRVKGDARVQPPIFDLHTPAETASEPEMTQASDGGGEFDDDGGEDSLMAAVGKIRGAQTFLAGKQALKSATAEPSYKDASAQKKAGLRLALWTRYVDLFNDGAETVEKHADFTLMRLFLEFGAKSEADVDAVWPKFWRHAAYKEANDADKAAISGLMTSRKAELKGA